jgi:glycosyltransferase involved in cell wall biosynthesis
MKSGFGRNSLAVLSYLWKTGKYDIVEYASGPLTWSDDRCKEVPWKCYGALPDNNSDLDRIQDHALLRHIHYGAGNIDRVIELEKPDVYLGAEDIWAFNGYWNKPWWDKFPCVIWTTLDSLPIYPLAKEAAGKCENFWVWASFAEKALKEDGFDHVKTVYGAVGNQSFHPLEEAERQKFRTAVGIKPEEKVFGFVFRNQLRKLVGSLLEGFSKYLQDGGNGKLLLHTNWAESQGWNIPEFIKEFKIPEDKVLTTYVCANCKVFTVSPFVGQETSCSACGHPKSMITPNPVLGISESQMNIIYNMMDGYIHPMTSGGLEMPIIEAMMAGLPVATVPYSCGTEYTDKNFVYSIGFDTYREQGSNFIKATTRPDSIKNFMAKLQKNPEGFKKKGLEGAEWARDAFSDEKFGKFFEDFVDNLPENTYDYKFAKEKKNPDYPMPDIANDTDWLIDIYSGILKMNESQDSQGVNDWLKTMENGASREDVYKYFVTTAQNDNAINNPKILSDFIEKNDNKKLCYMMPQSLGDCYISLNVLESAKRLYPDYEIYVCTKPENFAIFRPMGYKLIPYSPEFENFQLWEGIGSQKGVVDIFFAPFFATQRFPNYTHNGLDINELQSL